MKGAAFKKDHQSHQSHFQEQKHLHTSWENKFVVWLCVDCSYLLIVSLLLRGTPLRISNLWGWEGGSLLQVFVSWRCWSDILLHIFFSKRFQTAQRYTPLRNLPEWQSFDPRTAFPRKLILLRFTGGDRCSHYLPEKKENGKNHSHAFTESLNVVSGFSLAYYVLS